MEHSKDDHDDLVLASVSSPSSLSVCLSICMPAPPPWVPCLPLSPPPPPPCPWPPFWIPTTVAVTISRPTKIGNFAVYKSFMMQHLCVAVCMLSLKSIRQFPAASIACAQFQATERMMLCSHE